MALIQAPIPLDLFGDVALLNEGGFFVGQLNEAGRPHGAGRSYHRDGSVQATLINDAQGQNSGRWLDGGLYGLATQRFIDGDLFTGCFVDGLFDGLGIFRWADGAVFDGEFAHGERNGFGAEWGPDGQLTQSGRWAKDHLVQFQALPLRCLQGKMLSKEALKARAACPAGFLLQLDLTGRFYIGELNAREQPHGQGASFFANGTAEVSLLADPKPADKHGRWINGTVSGRALKQLENGDRLDGFFSEDHLEGLVSVQRARGSAIPIEEALLHIPDREAENEQEEKEDGAAQAPPAATQPAHSSA